MMKAKSASSSAVQSSSVVGFFAADWLSANVF